MTTIIKSDHDSIMEYLRDLTIDELVCAVNVYCDNCNYPDDQIYYNDEEFFKTFFTDPNEAVRAVFYGDYRYMDPYVKFNGYGNLDSYNEHNLKDDICLDDIAEDIFSNPDDYNVLLEEEEYENC